MPEKRTIVIDPVTRIEGHAKITLHLDEQGEVSDARFHVTQFRGFEKLCEGRPFTEMPSLMARICGICPVSHLMASAKACDALLAVRIPPDRAKAAAHVSIWRRLSSRMRSASFIFLRRICCSAWTPTRRKATCGEFSNAIRNWLATESGCANSASRLSNGWAASEFIRHGSCPGGVSEPLSLEDRDAILATVPEALAIALRTLAWFKKITAGFREEISSFGNFPSLFMGTVKEDGCITFYGGKIRFGDASGNIVADGLDATRYFDYLGEKAEPWSYLKSAYYKPKGYPEGMYRVGPLARLNVVDRCGTERADQELAEFKELQRGAVLELVPLPSGTPDRNPLLH